MSIPGTLPFCDRSFDKRSTFRAYDDLKKKNKVGTIGARLYYPSGRIQHGGVMLYQLKNGKITVAHKGIYSLYGASHNTQHNVFANPGALLMISKKLFERAKCFYPTDDCFEDIILSISMILRKKENIFVGEAAAIHHESISRKKDKAYQEKIQYNLEKHLIPLIVKYKKQLNPYATLI